MKPDARTDYRNDYAYAKGLIEMAARQCGSIAKLVVRSGISRRRLNYLLVGHRQSEKGMIPVRISFAEQITLEAIVNERST